MKILWIDPENSKRCIGILDDCNYVLAKLTKSKGWESYQWFNSLNSAVLRVCKLKANERCTDLSDWLEHFNLMLAEFEELMAHTEGQGCRKKGGGRAGNTPYSEKTGNDLPLTSTPVSRPVSECTK